MRRWEVPPNHAQYVRTALKSRRLFCTLLLGMFCLRFARETCAVSCGVCAAAWVWDKPKASLCCLMIRSQAHDGLSALPASAFRHNIAVGELCDSIIHATTVVMLWSSTARSECGEILPCGCHHSPCHRAGECVPELFPPVTL